MFNENSGTDSNGGEHCNNACLLPVEATRLSDQDTETAGSDISQRVANISLSVPRRDTQLDEVQRGAAFFKDRYDRTTDLSDLNAIIAYEEKIISLIHQQDPRRPASLSELAASLEERFQQLDDLQDIDRAILLHEESVQLTPDGHSEKRARLNGLGLAFQIRFDRLGTLEDVEKALSLQEDAVGLTPNGDPSKPKFLDHLGLAFQSRYEQLGKVSDLDRAILVQEEAIRLMPDGHPDRQVHLNNLGISFQYRFERLGSLADLDKTIFIQEEALTLTPNGHPDRQINLSNLGNSFQARFEQRGSMADLDRAISTQEEAICLTPKGHPARQINLNNLGNSMQCRFDRLGSLADLDRAILVKNEAVQLTPDGHPHKQTQLNNLGLSLECRFMRLRALSDLGWAISLQDEAVRLTPDNHPDKPANLNNLALSLQSRFDQLGSLVDLNRAISALQSAVCLVAESPNVKSIYLSNLGVSLQCRFFQLKFSGDLKEAILSQEEAVRLSPDGHPDKQMYLSNLGISLQCRFRELGDCFDLDRAISMSHKAINLTPDGHPSKVMRLHVLGQSLRHRFITLGNSIDVEDSIKSLSASATSIGASQVHRRSALLWAELALQYPQADEELSPLQACRIMIGLIPRLVWLGNTVEQRYRDIQSIGKSVNYITAIACQVGKPDLALEWLEQGRSIVWGQMLNLRSPVDDLSLQHPELAAEIRDVACRLDQYALGLQEPIAYAELSGDRHRKLSAEELAQQHRRHAEKYEQLLARVRQHHGFEDFLLPQKISVLAQSARLGPVVVINVDKLRCDALVLHNSSRGHVGHVPLLTVSLEGLKAAHDQLMARITQGRIQQRYFDHNASIGDLDNKDSELRKMFKVSSRVLVSPRKAYDERTARTLEMLWFSIVKPILDYLGYISSTLPDVPPHITWCLTGPLTFLPLHAAGCYGPGEETLHNKVYHYVVSSYTPSLFTLIPKSQGLGSPDEFSGLVAVSQSTTLGCNDLPGTIDEVNAIKSYFEHSQIRHLHGSNATMPTVLQSMKDSSWIHLACHGTQHRTEPMKSAFMLYDGPLQLSMISQQSLPHARFAFLSACQTATGDENLPEESVHLAAGMLMAGYRSVIGTMWSIRDQDGPVVADAVYRYLTPGMKTEDGQVAYALHKAIKMLRERNGEMDFLSWIPFAHFGI